MAYVHHPIGMSELKEAIERVISELERKSHRMSHQEKVLTAYHKGGHATVGRFLTHHDRVHKITIIPRGLTGGITRFLHPEYRQHMTRSQFKDLLASALAGMRPSRWFSARSARGLQTTSKATNLAR